jgi:hypothetical protein
MGNAHSGTSASLTRMRAPFILPPDHVPRHASGDSAHSVRFQGKQEGIGGLPVIF